MKSCPISSRVLLVASLLLSSFAAQAYPYDPAASNLPMIVVLSGTDSRSSGVVQTYNIPISSWPQSIQVQIKGGDGGNAHATGVVSGSDSADGGSGARVSANFRVDPSAPNALRPGGQLRVVVGNRGKSANRDNDAAAGGGGATAVLYLDPTEESEWIELAVAGGGGGAIASHDGTNNFGRDGYDALTTTSAGDGGNYSGSGGENGQGGAGNVPGAGGGGGYLAKGGGTNIDSNQDAPGGQPGRTGVNFSGEQYMGGVGGKASGGGTDGGYGYGAGGGSHAKNISDPAAGGGGGGYSGGGSGQSHYPGGGGGSYVLSTFAQTSSITQTTSNETAGTAVINYSPTQGTTLNGPVITLTGSNPTTVLTYQTYTDPGATALDVYGNDVTVTLASSTVQNGNPGTYLVTYIAEDQFGNTTSANRTVKVVTAQVPDFSILGDLARSKDSGAQSINGFAYDFDANDSGQSLAGYVLTNDNNALFSVQPAVNTSGKLTFTPAGNLIGTATVTITGYDDGQENNASSQTFTITIEDIDPVAAFSTDRTLVVAGKPVQFNDASSDAVEWEWDFDNDGNIDSTAQNPSHVYTTAGTYSVKLKVRNTSDENSVTKTGLIRVVGPGLVNADFSSSALANGGGDQNSLGNGWYAKNGDDGEVTTPDWSTGLTTGTPGVLTQIKSSGTGTRFGQFFANPLTGDHWALRFNLNGSFSQVRIWGGTLAANPSGTVLTGDNTAPEAGLVDGNGWTSVLLQSAVSATGNVTLNIAQDLGQFDVLAIQFMGVNGTAGTTFDNFEFVQQTAPIGGNDSYETTPTDSVTGNVLSNDSGAYNDPVAVTAVEGEAANLGTSITLPSGALLTLGSDGAFTYDPNGAFDALVSGATTSDSFTYTVENNAGSTTAEVTLTISAPDFAEWSAENGTTATFDADDNHNGQPDGFDYIFGTAATVEILSPDTIAAPSNVPADVVLSLQASSNLTDWFTVLIYTDGVVSFQASTISIADGVISWAESGDTRFYRYTAHLTAADP